MKLTARKWNGDDRYSWAIFRDGSNKPIVSGLSKNEVPYYKRQIIAATSNKGETK